MGGQFVEIDLAEDVQDLLSHNADIQCNEEIKKEIFSKKPLALLKVTKTINSPLSIIAIEEVTPELLASEV